MNRRQFLRFAAVPVAAAVALPELARTIILPPRGGWPTGRLFWQGQDGAIYTHQAYALGYTITEDVLDEAVYAPIGRGNRLLNRAEFSRLLQEGLNKVFTEAYTVGLPDENGVRVPFRDEWAELFAAEEEPVDASFGGLLRA